MAPDFSSRPLRFALLAWVAVFFTLVVPLHHRGLIGLPGAAAANAQQAGEQDTRPYCPLCSIWDSANGDPPPADAPIGCAICHLKSNLELPPAWTPPPDLVADLEFLLPATPVLGEAVLTATPRLRGRAPPARLG